MAKVIDKKVKVLLGNCIRVYNVEKLNNHTLFKYKSQNDAYICVHTEDKYGADERPLLFTKKEFNKLVKIILPQISSDKLIKGRIYDGCKISSNDVTTNIIRLTTWDNVTYVCLIPNTVLAIARNRALNHPNSVTKKNKLIDMFD